VTNVLSGDEREGHVATRAWRRVRSKSPSPTAIETLKETVATSVYRLHGVGPAAAPIIAKRSYADCISVELSVYEQILPTTELPVLRCYGGVEQEDGGWLFLEDVGGRPYSEDRVSDRALAARWLGVMHASTTDPDLAARFPAVGLDHYLDYLRLARSHVSAHLARGGLHRQSRAAFDRILEQLDALERCWSSLVGVWGELPRCLVHGDFISSNVHVRESESGPALHVIDWSRAGWGVPAKDVGGLDFDAYWYEVQHRWSRFGRDSIQTMANVGNVLRYLDWIEGTAEYLASSPDSWIEPLEADLLLYGELLERAILKAGLL
jgi:hypothetical protein